MTRSPKRTNIDAQLATFIDAARQLGCDESETSFDAALKKVGAHRPASDPPPAKKPEMKKPAK